MPLHTWRRQHGSHAVAQVVPLEGLGVWEASAWPVGDPSALVRNPRKFEGLMSAQAAADHLVRTKFDHRCDPHACGEWMFWSQ